MMPYTIVIADEIPAEALDILKKTPHIILRGMEHLPKADALLIRSVAIDSKLIDSAPRLKIIARAGVGMDAVDTAHAESKGIACVNAAGGNSICASEHTMGLMLSMAHRIAYSHHQIMGGLWDRTTTEGFELSGKTLGVVGCGNVGSKVCRLALAFGMKVLVFDPYISTFPDGVEIQSSLDGMLPKIDILTLHVPLTNETRLMINAPRLALFRDGAGLVNASRGQVVDIAALVDAAPRLAGIALDVFPEEPLPPSSPLRSLPKVTLTAHLGGASAEARLRVALMAVEQALRFLENL